MDPEIKSLNFIFPKHPRKFKPFSHWLSEPLKGPCLSTSFNLPLFFGRFKKKRHQVTMRRVHQVFQLLRRSWTTRRREEGGDLRDPWIHPQFFAWEKSPPLPLLHGKIHFWVGNFSQFPIHPNFLNFIQVPIHPNFCMGKCSTSWDGKVSTNLFKIPPKSVLSFSSNFIHPNFRWEKTHTFGGNKKNLPPKTNGWFTWKSPPKWWWKGKSSEQKTSINFAGSSR